MRPCAPCIGVTRWVVFLPLNTLSVPAGKFQRLDLVILTDQQPSHAVIVGIGVGPQIGAILELAACVRGLQQQVVVNSERSKCQLRASPLR